MSMRPLKWSDITDNMLLVGIITIALAALVAGVTFRSGSKVEPKVVLAPATATSSDSYEIPGQGDMLWDRDNGGSNRSPAPSAKYDLPMIPQSRIIWNQTFAGGKSWGVKTPLPAIDCGIAVLEHYASQKDWTLKSSTMLGLSDSAWSSSLVNEKTGKAVLIVATPTVFGSAGGGKENETKVSIMYVDAEKYLGDVLDEQIAAEKVNTQR